MAKKKKYERVGICMPLLFITITLTVIGIIMVFSATYNASLISSDGEQYFGAIKSQGAVAIVGIIAMLVISAFDYHFLRYKIILFITWGGCILLLFLALASGGINNSRRWIKITEDITLQPSEFAKFMAVICAARYVAYNKDWFDKKFKGWLPIIFPIGFLAILVLAGPDLSTTMCLAGAVVVVLFVSGMPKRYLLIGVGLIVLLVPIMIMVTKYQGNRIEAWLHAWEGDNPKGIGYQIVQSLYAIGDGGLFGVGLGNSKQKITHLPMSETDYIFSIICEEFGLVGGVVVVGLYAAYAYFGVKIAMEASDRFGSYLATGITTLVIFQAIINMCVATNVFPSTGLTLPFISKGATSLAVMLCATGLLLSISSVRKTEATDSNG